MIIITKATKSKSKKPFQPEVRIGFLPAISSNQSILEEISSEYSLEGLMPKLKLQYPGHQMRRADSLKRPWCWERLKAGGEGDDRGWDGWMASLTQWTWVWANSWRWCRTGKPAVHGVTKSQTRLSDWTELNWVRTINPKYLLEGLMLKLKLQYFGHLMQRADSPEKTLMLGKTEGRRIRGDRGWDG